MQEYKVLVIEDEISINDILTSALRSEGYSVRSVFNGKEARKLLNEFLPNIVLLDINLPDESGFDICKDVTQKYSIPILMLTARIDIFDKILGLELGADDYVVKPFEPKELLARVKAVMRRYTVDTTSKEVLHYSDLVIDANSYNVVYKGKEIKMPPKEFELVYYLACNKNKVFTREQLLCEVWGYDYPGDSRTVDVHVKRLREKLAGGENWQIETVWGVGYKFEVR